MKNILITGTLIIIFILGLTLVFIDPIQDFIIERSGEKLNVTQLTPKKIQANENIDNDTVDFSFEEVQTLSVSDVLKAQSSMHDFPVLGGMAIPSVKLQLPIVKGVSTSALAVGAGTMKPEQQLGTGNYALAGHYIEGRDVLFGPLYNVAAGDTIYLTDLTTIYEYTISNKEVIQATDVHVIDDMDNVNNLTLITCADEGTNRLAVYANLSKSYPFDDAPKKIFE